jgi:predicted nuclease of predicted toxin-antitoxin system
VKLLIDAQLPRRLVRLLALAGHYALHTMDLPSGNRTTDADVIATADAEGRVVVTKDSDFVDSFLISGKPEKPLLVSTGNVTNVELEALVLSNLAAPVTALAAHRFVELNRTAVIVHV